MKRNRLFAQWEWLAGVIYIYILGGMGLWGQDANSLFEEGRAALNGQAYDKAIERFEQVIKDFPTSPIIDSVNLNLGLAQLFSGKFSDAIVSFDRASASTAPREIREAAIFYKAQAQLGFLGNLPKDDPKYRSSLEGAIKNFSQLIEEFPDSTLLEDAIYGRAVANFTFEKINDAEKDLERLIKNFATSPNIADYRLLLGSIYAQEVFKAINNKRSQEEIERHAEKALSVLQEIKEASPEYVMAANEARLLNAELMLAMADERDPKPAEKAIEIAREVMSKDQMQRQLEMAIDKLKADFREANLARNLRLADALQLRINRRRSQLEEIKRKPDPIVRAWLVIGQSYFRLGKWDEARVVMSHILPHTTEEQAKSAEFVRILTYAIQGAVEEADALFENYRKKYPNDTQADSVSLQIGINLLERKSFAAALEQFDKSLRDYPNGRNANTARIKRAEALIGLGKTHEAIQALQEFISSNGEDPLVHAAQFLLANIYAQTKQFDFAIKIYQELAQNPKAGEHQALAAYQIAATHYLASNWKEAAEGFQNFVTLFPQHNSTPQAYYFLVVSHEKNNKIDEAKKSAEALAEKFPASNFAPAALDYVGRQLNARALFDEMVVVYQRLIELFPKSKEASTGYFMIARNFERQARFQEAAEKYDVIANDPENSFAPSALQAKVSMWLKAARSLGAYSAITEEEKKQWHSYLTECEKAAKELIRRFPSSPEVPQALDELIVMLRVKNEAQQMAEEEAENYFSIMASEFDSPIAQPRILAAQAGLLFQKNKLQAAYDTFQKLIEKYPDASLGAEDWNRYATLLLTNNKPSQAAEVFLKIQKEFSRDPRAQANATYGLGAAYLAQGELQKAIPFFEELKSKYPWSEKIMEAEFALAMADEAASKFEEALDRYRTVIMSNVSTPELKARAMIASGKILENQNKLLPIPQSNEPNAESFYLQPDAFFRESVPNLSAEGLFLAAQINIKKNNLSKAKEILLRLTDTPAYRATPWYAKGKEALSRLPQ